MEGSLHIWEQSGVGGHMRAENVLEPKNLSHLSFSEVMVY